MHGGAEVVQGLLVIFVGAMGKVEASDVHAGPEKLFEHGDGARGGAQRAHDLSLGNAPIIGDLLQNALYVYVCHSNSIQFKKTNKLV